jgi:TBC1 domain family member 14
MQPLASHLEDLRVEPAKYMDDMFSTLFCNRLSIEHAARVMDVYAIEGDKIPPRVALGVLLYLEGACYQGSAEEVIHVLQTKEIKESPDEFMGRVYEAGKSSTA